MKKALIGIILIIVALGGIIFYETQGREMFLYDEVLVFAQDVEENTVVTKNMLATRTINEANKSAYTIKDVEKVIGKETTHFIPRGSELYEAYFEDESLIAHANLGEYVLSIPNGWLESYPQSLRRGDTVFFWCEGTKVTSAKVVYVKDNTNTEVTSDEDRLTASSTVSLIEVIATEDMANLLSSYAQQSKKFVILYN